MRLSQSQNSHWPRNSHWLVIPSSPLWLGMDCRHWPRGERLHLPTSANLISLQGKGPWRRAPIHHKDSFGQSAHYITGFNKKLLEAAVLVTDVNRSTARAYEFSQGGSTLEEEEEDKEGEDKKRSEKWEENHFTISIKSEFNKLK